MNINNQLKVFLEEKFKEYNNKNFITTDPISIPHRFTNKEDIEIAGFFAASIAWGGRKAIINSANKLMDIMGNSPFDFVMNANQKQIDNINIFVHRTFNSVDCKFFVFALRNIYNNYGGLENLFSFSKKNNYWDAFTAISNFGDKFFEIPHPERTVKHIANPLRGSAAKRINMYLRWMVRNDANGVDFGLWNKIPTSKLICPLDVHSGRISRKLGLLNRKSNDWKAAIELTNNLITFDAEDPVKYDFALFGLGVFEKF